MANLVDIYQEMKYPAAEATMTEILETLVEFDIDDFDMSWRSSSIDISIINGIIRIEENINYIYDELLSKICDKRCKEDIENMTNLVCNMPDVLQFRFREHYEIENKIGKLINPDVSSDIENDRLFECLDTNAERIEQLISTYKNLVQYLGNRLVKNVKIEI